MSAKIICAVTLYTCMGTSLCFEKNNAFGSRVRWHLGKMKLCCYFCSYFKFLVSPLFVTNWRLLLWKSRPHKQFKNCWMAPRKFSEWIYWGLRIISRNPLKEMPKHFHLNNTLPSENYNWNLLGLQLRQLKTCPCKNLLRLYHSVFWPASGQKSYWNMTANQKTANLSIVSQPIREKNRIWFLNIWSYK